MGKRKISILEPAAEAVADIAGKGLPAIAKKFVDEVFLFFGKISDERIVHKPCNYNNVWKYLGYRFITYKKYVIAYLSQPDEIIICDFTVAKILK